MHDSKRGLPRAYFGRVAAARPGARSKRLYARSRPSFKFPNTRAVASSEFSRSNIVQGELRVCRRNTRSTLAVFSCSTRSRDFLGLPSVKLPNDPKRASCFPSRDSKQQHPSACFGYLPLRHEALPEFPRARLVARPSSGLKLRSYLVAPLA